MRNISNSEVTAWLTCRRLYKYAYVYDLEPKKMSTPLARGNIGHEGFQRYTEARIDGDSHEKAIQAAHDVFLKALQSKVAPMETVMETRMLWDRYMAFHNGWPEWILHQPEQRFELPLTEDFKIVIRYDTLVEEKRTGRILIGDYKFTYDFWKPIHHDLNPQMPKYIAVMNANGIKVDAGFLEEIRTRPLGKEKAADPKYTWRRTPYHPSNARKVNMLKQHIAASMEISEFRALPKDQQEFKALPLLNKHGACDYCSFSELCNSENNGKDIAYDIEYGFQRNSYGYNKEEVIEGL